MEIIAVFDLILSLVAIMVFFFMASNVSEIRKTVCKDRALQARIEYRTALFLEDKQRAYDALVYLFFYHVYREDREYWEKAYKKYLPEYQETFAKLGKEVPEFQP